MPFEALSKMLLHYVFETEKLSQEEIKRVVFAASDLFTIHERERPLNYFVQKEALKGYLLYFVPVNLHKIYLVMKEILRHPSFVTGKKEMKIIDLGCGVAPSILAFLELQREHFLPGVRLDYLGVDMDPSALKVAQSLAQAWISPEEKNSLRFLKIDLRKEASFGEVKNFHPHLFIMSNSLGEILHQGISLTNVSKKIRSLLLEENLTVVLIEPGTKKASQKLHFLRDSLVERSQIAPYSPCLHNLPCPALKVNNWCYEEWAWQCPDYLRFLEPLDLQIRYLKFSYAVFTSSGHRLAETFLPHEGLVIKCTSHLLGEKRKSRLWGCVEGELKDIEKLARDYTENDPWLTIRKGTYFSTKGLIPLGKKYRLPKDARVRILYHPPTS